MLRYRLATLYAGLRRLRPGARTAVTDGFRILLFHDIEARHVERFDRLLGWLERESRFLAPDEAADWLAGTPPKIEPAKLPPCLIAFDDGFASNHAVAGDVLARRGIKALFFVCPGLVGLPADQQRARIARHIFDGRVDAGAVAPGQRLMNWDEVRALRAMGHAVGNHGMLHRRLSQTTAEKFDEEINAAADLLAGELGHETPWYAYAFGDIDSISPAALAVIAKRHKICRSGVRGINGTGTPRAGVYADAVDLDATEAYWRVIVDGGLDFKYAAARERLLEMASALR
jgi:peptidoglycan/xylan/chitin deacetylase (PgdA/CDA1 family)